MMKICGLELNKELLPTGWEIVSLFEIFDVIKNGTCYNTNNTSGFPMTRIETMSKGEINYDLVGYSETEPTAYRMQYGDILFSHINSLAYIGKVAYYYAEKPLYHGMNVLLLRTNKAYNSRYIFYLLSSNAMKKTFELIAKPAINQASISTKDLGDIQCAVPTSIEEQTRIANYLDSINNLLHCLSMQINKNAQIKDGAMQELLTGKKRLEGFSEDWLSVRLEEIEIKNGSMLKSSEYEKGTIPVIAGGVSAAGFHSKANRPSNTITISGSGANAGFVNYFDVPIFASDCSTINEQKMFDVKYLYYALLLKQSEIYKCQAGGAQPHIHAKDIKDIAIPLPPLKREQVAIAAVLTEFDEKIRTIKSQRDKYLLIKQGMMQELLTGETRLI